MEIRYGEQEITALLHKIRTFDPSIGSYELFTLNHSFEYLVKLSNGSISFKVGELIKSENNQLEKRDVQEIAGRFIPDGLHAANAAPVASKSGMRSGIVLMVTVVVLVVGGIAIAVVRNHNNSKRVYIETKVEQPASTAGETASQEDDGYDLTESAPQTPEEIAMEQKAVEMRDPFSYLRVTSDYRVTIIMNLQIEGTVMSSATKASYRNITVRVKFYDKNDELLGQEDHKIPDILAPGQKASFSFKAVGRYGKTAKVVHELVSATPF